jgi:hypothetical protein
VDYHGHAAGKLKVGSRKGETPFTPVFIPARKELSVLTSCEICYTPYSNADRGRFDFPYLNMKTATRNHDLDLGCVPDKCNFHKASRKQ